MHYLCISRGRGCIYDVEGCGNLPLLCRLHLSGLRTWPVISEESAADEEEVVLSDV